MDKVQECVTEDICCSQGGTWGDRVRSFSAWYGYSHDVGYATRMMDLHMTTWMTMTTTTLIRITTITTIRIKLMARL